MSQTLVIYKNPLGQAVALRSFDKPIEAQDSVVNAGRNGVGTVILSVPLAAAAPDGLRLAQHITAMENDSYLTGHPEWAEIVKEAVALIDRVRLVEQAVAS